MKTRILIADDHKIFNDGLASLLGDQENIEVFGQALNGLEIFEKIREDQPDVILLDINMPEMDGIEACKKLNRDYPEIKVLALTMYGAGSFITGMLKSGAKGYLMKNSSKEELLEAIATVNRGETFFNKEITSNLISSMIPGTPEPGRGLIPKITRREKEILNLIVDEFTTSEIAEKLFVSTNTVETHRANLLSKLQAKNTAGLVKVAIEKGLLD